MTAIEAFKETKSNLPKIIDKKYQIIINDIKRATEKGEYSICFGWGLPDEKLVERLRNEGYEFYRVGDNFLMPYMYGITWKKKSKKNKNWFFNLFK